MTKGANRDLPDIGVVVSTYNRPEHVRRLLEALGNQTLPTGTWECVIVDNGSQPECSEAIQALAAESPLRPQVLRVDVNRGPAIARNLGWRSATAPFLAFTDDDCEPRPEWLEEGLASLHGSPALGVVQGRTVRSTRDADYRYNPLTVVREVAAPSPWFEGCNLFFRRTALEDAGGFDESFGFFGEETSLGWSVVEAGWTRGWADSAVVEHELTDRDFRWHMRFHYLERNIVRLARVHPEMRTMFWRPWAVKREGAFFALAVVGVLLSPKSRWALLLTLPYLRWLPPPWDIGVWGDVHQISAHTVSLVGKLAVGLRERTLVL